MTTPDEYLRNKLSDPRIRILACQQRRKLTFLPGKDAYPFYDEGTGIGEINKPLSEDGPINDYMVKTLDPRSYETHYDDTKNLYNRSS